MKRIIELPEKKRIMLTIMDYIDDFCRNNNINYFLYGGSLIGAIRHKGYIPWDDDIDICMMRQDYDKFLSLFTDPQNRYCLISPSNNSDYYLPTAKVYDSATVLNERVPNGIDIGIFIDVFPLDYCSDEYKETCQYGKKIGFYRKIVNIKNLSYTKNRSVVKNGILFFLKLLVGVIPKRTAINKICRLSERYKSKPSKYVGQFTKMTYESREIYESRWFDVAIDGFFEGRSYYIPKDYDEVLKTEYGEYMKLPPKEKQITHHGNDAWWRE